MIEIEMQKAEENSIKLLNEFKEQGYLFHGTANPNEIKEFEPRKANDPKSEWNADTAVYASGEPVWSAIFALYKGKDPWRTKTRTDEKGKIKEVTAYISSKYKDSIAGETGFVYVLPKETFEQEAPTIPQFKSHEPVKPVSRVEVTFSDYIALGGKIEWTDEGSAI